MTQIKVETATLGWPGLQAWSIDELHAIEFDFDRIGIAQATSRRLLAGRLGGQDCLVVSAAASPDAWDWLQTGASDAVRVGVVPDPDFEAALARHGSSMKAMDSVQVDDSTATSREPPASSSGSMPRSKSSSRSASTPGRPSPSFTSVFTLKAATWPS